MKVGIYSRVSQKRLNANGVAQSPENQLEPLRQWCAGLGHEVVEEYVDIESASGKKKRPAFDRMFKDAYQRRFDLLLFWSLDRLSREGAFKTLGHLDRLAKNGIQYHSYTEPYFDSLGPFRDAVVSIVGTIAQMEHQRLRERVVAGLERARREGKELGRPRRALDKERLLALRAEGLSYEQIARKVGQEMQRRVSSFTIFTRLNGRKYTKQKSAVAMEQAKVS